MPDIDVVLDFITIWGQAAGLPPEEAARRVYELAMSDIPFVEKIATMNKWAEEVGIPCRLVFDEEAYFNTN